MWTNCNCENFHLISMNFQHRQPVPVQLASLALHRPTVSSCGRVSFCAQLHSCPGNLGKFRTLLSLPWAVGGRDVCTRLSSAIGKEVGEDQWDRWWGGRMLLLHVTKGFNTIGWSVEVCRPCTSQECQLCLPALPCLSCGHTPLLQVLSLAQRWPAPQPS